MMLWLLNYLGIKGLAKWAVRLVALVLLLLGLLFLVYVLWNDTRAQNAAWMISALVIGGVVFRAVWNRRRGEAEAVERTIDGKIVPENLAVAALAVPEQSPDFEYVMRGLPDYSKMMLKLDAAAFEYVPEVEEKRLEAPIEKPADAAPSRPWFGLPRWALAAGAAGLLVVAGVGTWHSSRGRSAPPDVSQPVAAAETAPPAPVPVAPPTPSASPVAAPAPVVREDTAAPAPSGSLSADGDLWRNSTGDLWTVHKSEALEWSEANDFCRNLAIAGYPGRWALPSEREFKQVIAGAALPFENLQAYTNFWTRDAVHLGHKEYVFTRNDDGTPDAYLLNSVDSVHPKDFAICILHGTDTQ